MSSPVFKPLFVVPFLAAAVSCMADQSWPLDSINPALVQQDWGEAHIGLSVDGQPMMLGGKKFEHGIGTHANSEIEINLDGKATEFSATVGIPDDQKGTTAKVRFQVDGDGKKLWASGAMTPGEAKPVQVKLDGVRRLVLRVRAAGDGVAYDHADWADAAISYSGAAPAQAGNTVLIATDHLKFLFASRRDGLLRLVSAGGADGSWRLPLEGNAWPGQGDCPEHDAPVSIRQPNGDTALNLAFQDRQTRQVAEGIMETIVTLRDTVQPLTVELHYRAFTHEDAVQQWTIFRNGLAAPVTVTRLDSAYWEAPAGSNPCLEWYSSTWGSEAQPERVKLAKGGLILAGHDGERHIDGPVPAFVLGFGDLPDEDKTPCLIAALAWSGDARFAFDIDSKNILSAAAGVPREEMVPPGGAITTPVCIYSISPAGKGAASRNLQAWGRKYGLRDGNRLRPVDNNSWEGCGFNLSEKAVLDMIQGSAGLGIELYVLDDGWFGNGPNARVSDNAGLGDWQVNRERFPNGLGSLIQETAKDGMGFGLWFEPEMINPRSDLYQKHPEWVLRNPGRELTLQRNQAVLDLTNPAVQDYVFHAVSDILDANPGIRFVKWDCNSNLNNRYSPWLPANAQGELVTKYMAGYYSTLQKLVLKYPKVDFQACASGSGRGDYGALQFSHTFWVSDNTNPMFRLGAQWDYSTFLPAIAETCHVTHSGDFQPKFRFDVAMIGQLGMEIDPRKAEPEFQAAAKTGITAYKSVREIVQFGVQYRHASPFESPTPSLNYVTSDQSRALVLAYQIGDRPGNATAPISGLDPARSYKLSEINLPPGDDKPRLGPGAKLIATGREWMGSGIPLIYTRRYDSAALSLEAVH